MPLRFKNPGILPDHLLFPVTGDVRESRVYPLDNALGIGDHNAFDAVFKDIIRQHQLPGGALRLGDVLDNAHELDSPAMVVALNLGVRVDIPLHAIRPDYAKIQVPGGIACQQRLQPGLHHGLIFEMDIPEEAFITVGSALLVHPEKAIGLLGTDKIVLDYIPLPISKPGDVLGLGQASLAAPQIFLNAPPFENLLVKILVGFGQVHCPFDNDLLKVMPVFFQFRIVLAKFGRGRSQGLVCRAQFPVHYRKSEMQHQKGDKSPHQGQDNAYADKGVEFLDKPGHFRGQDNPARGLPLEIRQHQAGIKDIPAPLDLVRDELLPGKAKIFRQVPKNIVATLEQNLVSHLLHRMMRRRLGPLPVRLGKQQGHLRPLLGLHKLHKPVRRKAELNSADIGLPRKNRLDDPVKKTRAPCLIPHQRLMPAVYLHNHGPKGKIIAMQRGLMHPQEGPVVRGVKMKPGKGGVFFPQDLIQGKTLGQQGGPVAFDKGRDQLGTGGDEALEPEAVIRKGLLGCQVKKRMNLLLLGGKPCLKVMVPGSDPPEQEYPGQAENRPQHGQGGFPLSQGRHIIVLSSR